MNKEIRLNKLIKSAGDLNGTIKYLKKQYSKKRDTILGIMKNTNKTKYENGEYIVTVRSGYKRKAFSLPKFRKLEPKLYKTLASNDKFTRISKRRPSIQLRKKLIND